MSLPSRCTPAAMCCAVTGSNLAAVTATPAGCARCSVSSRGSPDQIQIRRLAFPRLRPRDTQGRLCVAAIHLRSSDPVAMIPPRPASPQRTHASPDRCQNPGGRRGLSTGPHSGGMISWPGSRTRALNVPVWRGRGKSSCRVDTNGDNGQAAAHSGGLCGEYQVLGTSPAVAPDCRLSRCCCEVVLGWF